MNRVDLESKFRDIKDGWRNFSSVLKKCKNDDLTEKENKVQNVLKFVISDLKDFTDSDITYEVDESVDYLKETSDRFFEKYKDINPKKKPSIEEAKNDLENIYTILGITHKYIIQQYYVGGAEKIKQRADEVKQGLEEFHNKFESKFEDIQEKYDSVDVLKEEAKDILEKILSSKLGGIFAENVEKIDGYLKSARTWHLGAIATVLLSVIAIGLMHIKYVNLIPDGPVDLIFSIGRNLLYLFPSLLFVSFTNKNYKNYYDLREHYRHKQALSFSISRFREYSGEYKDLVSSMMFESLTDNAIEEINNRGKKGRKTKRPLFSVFNNQIKKTIEKSPTTKTTSGDN